MSPVTAKLSSWQPSIFSVKFDWGLITHICDCEQCHDLFIQWLVIFLHQAITSKNAGILLSLRHLGTHWWNLNSNKTRQIWGIWKLRPAYSPEMPIWVKIGDVLSHVTLKFDGWPWKTIGHLSFAVSSFVQHFIAIGEFKLELLSGNAQFGSNSTIFRAVWPWNLTYDLEKE